MKHTNTAMGPLGLCLLMALGVGCDDDVQPAFGGGTGGAGGSDATDAEVSADGAAGGAEGDAGVAEDGAVADATAPGPDAATVQPDAAPPMPDAAAIPPDAGPPPRYHQAVFRSVEDAYRGDQSGERGTVLDQLEGGARFLDFDVHDDDFEMAGGFRIGLERPGHQVATGQGNPATDALRDWLRPIAQWSDAHPDHAPLTIALDVQDDLTEGDGPEDGDLADLDDLVTSTFGDRLVQAADAPQRWPVLDELRGRVLVVLGGVERNRLAYRLTLGENPAVGVNGLGQVVMVHSDGDGNVLWRTGERTEDGAVAWRQRGTVGPGLEPAVDINDDGWVVVVAAASVGVGALRYTLGRLDGDLGIQWAAPRQASQGEFPTVRFTASDGPTLELIHRAFSAPTNQLRVGTIDANGFDIDFAAAVDTDRERFDRSLDQEGAGDDARWVRVQQSDGVEQPAGAVLAATDAVGLTPVRGRQVLFVELRAGDVTVLRDDDALRFVGASAGASVFAQSWQVLGRLVRFSGFAEAADDATTPVNFPATAEPRADWYEQHLEDVRAVE